jgi:opacity protein-like surface antigen
VNSVLHSVGVGAHYTVAEGVVANFGYRFEKFDNDDFALETGSSLPAVITLGSQSLDYTAHVVGVSATVSF